MDTPFPNLTVADEAGPHGETLETCTPIVWPGIDNVTEHYVKTMLTRLLAATFRDPTYLNIFALRKTCLTKILVYAKELFANEKTVLDVLVPYHGRVHVFGDTHGDFHSLLEALSRAGLPDQRNFLCFAGDLVDRGCWGVELVVVVCILKIWRPNSVFVVRGNHETTGCIKRYGFYEEVERKYDVKTLNVFTNTFREIPCVAILRLLPSATVTSKPPTEKKNRNTLRRSKRSSPSILCETAPAGEGWRAILEPGERRVMVMHGGLFRSWRGKKGMQIGDLPDLMECNRRQDDPDENIVSDVLWSDPQTERRDVAVNLLRGAGILYGEGAVASFFRRNGLCGMIRAHEGPDMRERRKGMADMLDGFSIDMEMAEGFLATVFTTADYPPDRSRGNLGAFATLHGMGIKRNQVLPEFTKFEKREVPEDAELFYRSADNDSGATPRHSFC